MSWNPVKWTKAQLLCVHLSKLVITKELICFLNSSRKLGKFYPPKFKTSGFKKEAGTPKPVSTAFSINEVANKLHSVLFGSSSMLSAVETGFGVPASFLKLKLLWVGSFRGGGKQYQKKKTNKKAA